MSATTKVWVDNSAPTLNDDDLNGFKNENNNLIVGAGLVLSTADAQQTHKAVSIYSAGGDYYDESGAADAYVLDVAGSRLAPPAYFNGMRVRFVAGNANTGASTINVDGLGVKNIINDVTGTALAANVIPTSIISEAYYDGTDFRLTTLARYFVGTHTFSSIAAATLSSNVNITHGLGTDIFDFGGSIRGSDATLGSANQVLAGIMRPDGSFVYIGNATDVTAAGVVPLPATTKPSSGDITIRGFNALASATQDVILDYWLRIR